MNTLVDFLCEHLPENIKLMEEAESKFGSQNIVMMEAIAKAIYTLKQKAPESLQVPNEPIQLIDLSFELLRRLLAALKKPIPEVKGEPLSASPEGPFPKNLKPIPMRKYNSNKGLTQGMIDTLVNVYYSENKLRCYEIGEGYRRGVHSDFGTSSRDQAAAIKALISKNYGDSSLPRYRIPIDELGRRISATCKLP